MTYLFKTLRGRLVEYIRIALSRLMECISNTRIDNTEIISYPLFGSVY